MPWSCSSIAPDAASQFWASSSRRSCVAIRASASRGRSTPSTRARVTSARSIPHIIDREQATRDPQLAILSAVVHGHSDAITAANIAHAAIHGMSGLPDEQRVIYLELIKWALSDRARKAFEMHPKTLELLKDTPTFKPYYDGMMKGRAEGEAQGRAKSILALLHKRRIKLSKQRREQITSCTDLTVLETWFDRAITARSIDELFG